MIKQDQPTIFDNSKVRAVLSSGSDGNTKPEWTPLQDTIDNITHIAHYGDIDVDDIVVVNVGADQGTWDEIYDVTDRHGRGVENPEQRIPADALVTNAPGVGLLLPVADCNAVAIHDPIKHVLALVHLGWQSTVAGLATKIVQHLQQKYHSSATDLRIYFSPAIKAESYIFDHVSQIDQPDWKPFLHTTDEGVGVDLPGYNRQRFIDAGVPAEQIEVSPVNTATSGDYFSHYRAVRNGEAEGRFALLVQMM